MRCPKCNRFLRSVTKHDVSLEICQTCHGVWFGHGELDKLRVRLRQVQLDSEEQIEGPRPRPGLYDLDHCDWQRPTLTPVERKNRWSELLDIFQQ
jgi:Zn-finger nucleic acid-binding protein